MADTALIVGLAGSAGILALGVAPTVIGRRLAARREARARQRERATHEEELRAVLDEVAAGLDECEQAMHALEALYLRFGRTVGHEARGREALLQSGRATLRLARSVDRLAVRLGSHDGLTSAAAHARNGFVTFTSAVTNLAFASEGAGAAEHHRAMQSGKVDIERARTDFVAMTAAYGGSRTPERTVAYPIRTG
jgi:hypothetical protein